MSSDMEGKMQDQIEYGLMCREEMEEEIQSLKEANEKLKSFARCAINASTTDSKIADYASSFGFVNDEFELTELLK